MCLNLLQIYYVLNPKFPICNSACKTISNSYPALYFPITFLRLLLFLQRPLRCTRVAFELFSKSASAAGCVELYLWQFILKSARSFHFYGCVKFYFNIYLWRVSYYLSLFYVSHIITFILFYMFYYWVSAYCKIYSKKLYRVVSCFSNRS